MKLNKKLYLTSLENKISLKILKLKKESGSHSPSIHTLKEELPELEIKVDACFLSNPYATELYMEYFDKEIIQKNRLRDLLEFYPSQNSVIADLVSKSINVKSDKIFIGNGAIEIIQAIIHRFTKNKIVVNIPTFSSYYDFALDLVDVTFFKLKKENGYSLIIEEYINFINKIKPDTVVLINPNNPTGTYILKSDLIVILERLDFVENIIVDESFIHFAYEDIDFKEITISAMVEKYPNLYIVKSMSKDFGIAGIRAGYAIMHANKVSSLLKNGYLWNSNGLAEHFFRLYSDKIFILKYQKVRKKYIIETQKFLSDISNIPQIKTFPSSANFVLIELPENVSSEIITSILLIRYGIYVRNCDDKIGLEGNYLRIASRGIVENKLIFDSLFDLFS
jgi:histidinol-phosphate/aromatic aminotransferase/cobyric acid decarboxylase-like protein